MKNSRATRDRVLIFDLDGTISDPSTGIARSANFALETAGFPAVEESYFPEWIGPPLDTLFKAFVPGASPSLVAELVTTYRARYGSVGYAENTLYAGIPDVLSELRAKGYVLGVCTSKRVDFAEKILKMFGLKPLFDFVDGGEIGVAKSDQLHRLLSNGVVDSGAVMIGDRAVDIEAARLNDLGAVGVRWGFGGLSELQRANPTAVVESPAELLGVFP